jgi:Mn-dependent DtxR family transcriptional regulator
LKAAVLKELKKKVSITLEVAVRLRVPLQWVTYEISMLEEEGLIEYDLKTEKWRISRK